MNTSLKSPWLGGINHSQSFASGLNIISTCTVLLLSSSFCYHQMLFWWCWSLKSYNYIKKYQYVFDETTIYCFFCPLRHHFPPDRDVDIRGLLKAGELERLEPRALCPLSTWAPGNSGDLWRWFSDVVFSSWYVCISNRWNIWLILILLDN